ncbi:prolyl oligopeptidase family serine peptidase [Paracidobacterium acidisoli]|uniref:prolyl oligopeptidase n=1 Tax=Paracidobacterium acidisoli TaxID=2303751 RepID=A0A372IML0_9BACT|nr:prolyl oligopeptidase family serine peptidase [Paracidobacterium acidisoli]MBT9331600.1 prolyl oligopeptidase family serine peptidase [Paracidobacterium acidisoli]
MQAGLGAAVWRVALTGAAVAVFFFTAQAEGPVDGGNGIRLAAPPVAAVHVVTDEYHGVRVEDPYRWLEDAKSPATRAWIDEENRYTQQYLSQVKIRPQIAKQLDALQRVDNYSMPIERGGRYFFQKRLADENQASIYFRKGWKGADRRLVDATKLSADQNTSVEIEDISNDGDLLVYGVRQGGADELSVHVLRVTTGRELPDVLPSARYFGVNLTPDGKGIYYSRFTHEGTNVYLHTFGSAFSSDKKIFGGEYRGEKLGELDLVVAYTTDDEHYLMVNISHGVPATSDDILVKDLRKPESDFAPLAYGIEAHISATEADNRFFLQTDYEAPNGRIVEATPNEAPAAWKLIIPEGKDVIDGFSIAGGRIFVSRLHDVKTETAIYTLDGQQTGRLTYPGIGSGTVVYGRPTENEGFYSFESFITPPTIFRYDIRTGKSEVFAAPKVPFDSAQYEITQVFYASKDGTRVPMFIAGKKGLARDGEARLLMTGYGGFDVPELPGWNAEYAWWMEQGGFFAVPNLRGGNEYGEAWHKAAMFGNKQNVFDDFFAAAEYLIHNHYTKPERFAIRGRSNGGLLMGAAMTQRPDLFGAIWCGYPLLDMLRYQKFEFGRLWTTEYGSADDAKDFEYLRRYSPYQNVHRGTKYPAIMFFTGDNDTRVDPLHARKMTALMQAEDGGDRPILLHYSLKGGHSAGVSLSQLVEDEADELAFLWNETSAH